MQLEGEAVTLILKARDVGLVELVTQRGERGPTLRGTGYPVPVVAAPPPVSAQDSLQIHHIDVDQGDATLVVAPNGRTLLIDSGLSSHGDTVVRFLQQRGIDTLAAFLATHYDRDHYGGIPDVVKAGVVVEAWYDRGEKEFVSDKNGRRRRRVRSVH